MLLGLIPALAQAQTSEKAAIAGDPAAAPQQLALVDLPKATGPALELFNGRDLADWEAWLGYADPALTYKRPPIAPLGTSVDTNQAFSVVTEDGAPALRVEGKTWGSLVHKADLRDYRLSLEYKWGDQVWAPRLTEPQNNGLLFHSHGNPGVVWGTWMAAVEFEIMLGSTGMIVPVGDNIRARTFVAQDKTILYPHRRFRLGGRTIDVTNNGNPDWNVENAVDAEKPVGQWNRLDLYAVGDQAIFVVNGVPVMALTDLAELDSTGRRVPLTHGRIQLQSEGAETFFRAIKLEPIKAMPRLIQK
ncbi:3-keto-disaccharide hydrolase [Sphingomonas sp. M1-B02]|uniref:3-keto-disaccharide hydrolase n=1 Tax=Sphingomonas sp. M1-B02 TaxID=3114300 RepID=UPI00223F8F89|nr:DUF1080 domain-containing protein [Sphingomonas sp. S6-11]UZK65934.1 DUF1080 domain-containing protein [Sphingomonas sp. S6-11]